MIDTKISSRKHQRGFSLLELAIVIAVIAVLVIFVVRTSSSVSSTRKASAEVKGLAALIQSAKTYKTGGIYGAGSLVPSLIAGNQIPGEVAKVGAALNNQWGGAITIVGAGTLLTVQDTAVSGDACEAVVMGIGGGDSTMVTTVGGNVAVVANNAVSATAAETACGTGAQTIVITTSA